MKDGTESWLKKPQSQSGLGQATILMNMLSRSRPFGAILSKGRRHQAPSVQLSESTEIDFLNHMLPCRVFPANGREVSWRWSLVRYNLSHDSESCPRFSIGTAQTGSGSTKIEVLCLQPLIAEGHRERTLLTL